MIRYNSSTVKLKKNWKIISFVKVEFVYLITLDCTGVPHEVDGECAISLSCLLCKETDLKLTDNLVILSCFRLKIIKTGHEIDTKRQVRMWISVFAV